MTLLEVLASLVVLSMLLSGVLLAKNHALQQQATAQRRLQAIAAADQLMQQWWQDRGLPNSQGGGDVWEHPDMQWQVRVAHPSNAAFPFDTVSLQVIGRADDQVLAQVQWWSPPPTTQPSAQ